MAQTVKIEGLREVDAALGQLKKATGKAVLRRVLRRRAQPIADAAQAIAAEDSGELRGSAAVSTRLGKSQASKHRRMFRDDRAAVEMFAGFGELKQAHLVEFGSVHNTPKPAMRPAWDQNKDGVLDGLAEDLAAEVKKTADRVARRAALKAARGQ